MKYARKKHAISQHILINIDTHSDAYVYCPVFGELIKRDDSASSADWINYYIIHNPDVSEIYWVMPEDMLDNNFIIQKFVEKADELFMAVLGNCSKPPISVTANIWEQPLVQYFYVNKKEPIDFIEPANAEEDKKYKNDKNYRRIKFTTCTLLSLPKFNKEQNFVLSIDFDYFSNSGYDTVGNFQSDKNEKEIKALFDSVLKTLIKKNVYPGIISLTLSPVYVPKNDTSTMKNIANEFIKHSGKKDAIKYYKHKWHEREISKFLLRKQNNSKRKTNSKINSRKK